MKPIFSSHIFVFLISTLFFSPTACSSSKIPEMMPERVSIEYREDGGMRDRGVKLSLTTYQGQLEIREGKQRKSTTFVMTQDTLKPYYDLLREERFDEIELSKSVMHDKPGENVRLQFDGENIDVGTSGRMISSKWQSHWENIVSRFKAFVEQIKTDHPLH